MQALPQSIAGDRGAAGRREGFSKVELPFRLERGTIEKLHGGADADDILAGGCEVAGLRERDIVEVFELLARLRVQQHGDAAGDERRHDQAGLDQYGCAHLPGRFGDAVAAGGHDFQVAHFHEPEHRPCSPIDAGDGAEIVGDVQPAAVGEDLREAAVAVARRATGQVASPQELAGALLERGDVSVAEAQVLSAAHGGVDAAAVADRRAVEEAGGKSLVDIRRRATPEKFSVRAVQAHDQRFRPGVVPLPARKNRAPAHDGRHGFTGDADAALVGHGARLARERAEAIHLRTIRQRHVPRRPAHR